MLIRRFSDMKKIVVNFSKGIERVLNEKYGKTSRYWGERPHTQVVSIEKVNFLYLN